MKRIARLSALAAAFACFAAISGSPQAAPLTYNVCTMHALAPGGGLVSEVRWRRNCR